MAFSAPPGVQTLAPGAAQNLQAAISGVSAPPNPNTPDDRSDPREKLLIDLHRVTKSLQQLIDNGDPADPLVQIHSVVLAMYQRFLAGVDPQIALQSAAQAIAPLLPPPPAPPAPPMGAGPGGMGGAPGMGGGLDPMMGDPAMLPAHVSPVPGAHPISLPPIA